MSFLHLHAAGIASLLTPLVVVCCWVFFVFVRCDNCGLKVYERFAVIPLSCMIAFDLWIMSFFLRW